MAHTKAQDELQKHYSEGSRSLDDPDVEHMITQADKMMGKPARMLIAQAGLEHPNTISFNLLDHGCGTGLIASCLQEMIQPSVLSQSSIFCADINARLVDILLQRARRDQWINVDASVLDAQVSLSTTCCRCLPSNQTRTRGFQATPSAM